MINSDFEVVPGNEMVSLNGTSLAIIALGNGDLAFGTANSGVYPYIYHYEINSEGKEQVTWIINKEANKNDLLHFVFQIRLKNKPTLKGINILETNGSADVEYMSSKEVIDGVSSYTKTQSMASPQIEITIREVMVKYTDEEGNEIAESLSLRDIVGKEYSTFAKEIAGYEFVKVEGGSFWNLQRN